MSLNLLDFDWVAEQSLNQSGNVMSRLTPQIPVTKMVKDDRKPKQTNKQKYKKNKKTKQKNTHTENQESSKKTPQLSCMKSSLQKTRIHFYFYFFKYLYRTL